MSSLRSTNLVVRQLLRISTARLEGAVVCCRRSFIYCYDVNRQIGKLKTYGNRLIVFRNLSNSDRTKGPLDTLTYNNICEETLESLNEYFDELLTTKNGFPNSDVTYGDGVLTVKLGDKRGIYVINKQTPNKQIWLSSPISGPKRYDYIDGRWIYKHDGVALHDLLSKEFSQILKTETDFTKCAYG